MEEIRVIEEAAMPTDITGMNQAQRDMLFEALVRNLPQLGYAGADNFALLLQSAEQERTLVERQTIPELLLRQIIKLGDRDGDGLNAAIIPIAVLTHIGETDSTAPAPMSAATAPTTAKVATPAVATPAGATSAVATPTLTLTNAKVATSAVAATGAHTQAVGGAGKPYSRMWRQQAQKKITISSATKIRSDERTRIVGVGGMSYVAPPNEEINVVGIIVCQGDRPFGILDGAYYAINAPKAHRDPFRYQLVTIGVGDRRVWDSFVEADPGMYAPPTAPSGAPAGDWRLLALPAKFDVSAEGLYEYALSRHTRDRFEASWYLQLAAALRGSNVATRALREQIRAFVTMVAPDAPNAPNDMRTVAPGKTRAVAIANDAESDSNLSRSESAAPDLAPLAAISAISSRLSTRFRDNIIADLNRQRLLRAYYYTVYFGPDDPRATAQINEFKMAQARTAAARAEAMRVAAERARDAEIRAIYEARFAKQAGPFVSLEALPPAVRKSVVAEYTRRERYAESLAANKCPHLRALRAFRRATRTDRIRDTFSTLSKFFDNPKTETEMIACRQCKFDIICPHERTLVELEARRADTGRVSSALMRYVTLTHGAYYCRVCGQEITVAEFEPSQLEHGVVMAEELRKAIYGEVMFELRFLRFAEIVSTQRIVTAIRDTIYPFVAEIERQILKSRTASAEEVKAKHKLYISVYCMAYMVHMVMSDSKITFRGVGKHGGGGCDGDCDKPVGNTLPLESVGGSRDPVPPRTDAVHACTNVHDIRRECADVAQSAGRREIRSVEWISEPFAGRAGKRAGVGYSGSWDRDHLAIVPAMSRAGGAQRGASSRLVDTIKHAIGLIVSSKNSIISQLPDVTNDVIKNMLIAAYKAITGQIASQYVGETEAVSVTLRMDPVYHYLCHAHVLAAPGRRHACMSAASYASHSATGPRANAASTANSKGTKGPKGVKGSEKYTSESASQVDLSILGATERELEAPMRSVFASARVPTIPAGPEFARVAPLDLSAIAHLQPTGIRTRIAQLVPGLRAESFAWFWRVVAEKPYLGILANVAAVKRRRTRSAPSGQAATATYDVDALRDLIARENSVRNLVVLEGAKNVWCETAKNTRMYAGRPTRLARGFDAEGREHEFTLYVVETATGLQVLPLDRTAATIRAGADARVVARKCRVCGATRATSALAAADATADRDQPAPLRRVARIPRHGFSDTAAPGATAPNANTRVNAPSPQGSDAAPAEPSDAVIISAMRAKTDIENLFRFYENRCPVSGLHDLQGAKCTKCGRDFGATAAESPEYYAKYAEKYRDDLADMLGNDSKLEFPVPAPWVPPDYSNEYANWAFNFDVVLELSEKISVNHRAIMCLCAIERVEYADVLNGVYQPPEASHSDDTRVFALRGLVRNFLTEYNQLRGFGRLMRPPHNLVTLVESLSIPQSLLVSLDRALPEIYDSENERMRYFAIAKKPRETVDFCIETLCRLALAVYGVEGEAHAVAQAFVRYIVGKFLRDDELTTKHGHFNWGLLYPDQEKLELVERDVNFELEVEERVVTDDIDDPDREFGSTGEAFMHIEDLDVEEEGTGEDDSNQLRVEGYEMD
jgi:hypothetical protein